MTTVCEKCGTQARPGAAFCGACGHSLASAGGSARILPGYAIAAGALGPFCVGVMFLPSVSWVAFYGVSNFSNPGVAIGPILWLICALVLLGLVLEGRLYRWAVLGTCIWLTTSLAFRSSDVETWKIAVGLLGLAGSLFGLLSSFRARSLSVSARQQSSS